MADEKKDAVVPADETRVPDTWFWIRDSKGYGSVTVTFVTVAFWVKSRPELKCEQWILRTDEWHHARRYSGIDLRMHVTTQHHHVGWGTGRGAGLKNRRSIDDGIEMAPNQWLHIVYVMEEDRSFCCYENGCHVPTRLSGDADKVGHTKAPCKIGKDFIGDLDEIGMWKRALTPDEVKVLYRAGK